MLRPDITEKEVADEWIDQIRRLGGKWVGLPGDCGRRSPCRAAACHAHRPASVGRWRLLLIDWGANGGLYNSDLTRVLVTGKISPKLQRIYEVVLEAQTQAIAAIRPGRPARRSTPSPGTSSPRPVTAATSATAWDTA